MPATIAQFIQILAVAAAGLDLPGDSQFVSQPQALVKPGSPRAEPRTNATAAATGQAQVVGPKIPFQSLSGPFADRTRLILRQPIVKRVRAAEVFPCDPMLLEWLFNHPLWATELWRTMGVAISPLTKVGDGYECREENAMARVHVIHAEPGLRIAYCVGEARRPPLPGKLRAEMVVVQRYGFAKQTDGQYYAVQQLEAYAFAEGVALKTIMKLTRSACEQMVDHCLHDLTIYFAMLSRVLQVQPKWALEHVDRIRTSMPADEAVELTAIIARNPGRVRHQESMAAQKIGGEAPASPEPPPEPHGQATVAPKSPFVSSWTVGPDVPATERKTVKATAGRMDPSAAPIRR